MKTFEDLANPWVKGLAVYEPGKPIDEVARELGFASADAIIKLASNENSLGPSPKAMDAMRASVSSMHYYPDGGAFHLRQALSKRIGVEPSHISIGNGSNELIELLAHVFLGPKAGIVMADGAFIVYKLVAAAALAPVITVPMRAFTHDLDAMLAAIRPETRIVFVANPNNPSSTMVHGEAIDRFMSRIPDDVVVCFDEAYIELLDPAEQPDTIRYVREGRNVIVLRTFSKTYGLAGLRIGYGVAPAACVALLNRVRQPFNVNAMALAAALAALDDEEHVRRTRVLVRDGMAFFEASCRSMGLRCVHGVANFLLVEVGNGRAVFEAMQREGVIVRPVDGYGLPTYVRITIGTAAENERCVAALKRVLKK